MRESKNIKNRKQRRAEKKTASTASLPPFQAIFSEALRLHQAGRLTDAEELYKQVLAADPRHADSLHLLGLIAHQARRYDSAVELIRQAIEVKDEAIYYGNLGIVLKDQGKLDEAMASHDRALAINPNFAEVHSNRGLVLRDQGKLDEALASYDRALAIKPGLAEAHSNRGLVLRDQGKLNEALASCDRALAIKPDYAEAHNNRGNALHSLGKLDEAAASYDRALAIKPDLADAHSNHGTALRDQGKLDEAVTSYSRALAIRPDHVVALNNLALTMMQQGKAIVALNIIKKSLQTAETPHAKRLFVACVRRLRGMCNDGEVRAATIRALTEPWGRPSDLVGHAIDLIRGDPDVASCVTRAAEAWPNQLSAKDLFGSRGFTTLAADPLLVPMLETTTIPDIDMERFLTMARSAMLEVSMETPSSGNENGPMLRFYTALARQCFVNEYVFSSTAEEDQKASALKISVVAAVEDGAEIPVLWLVAVAAYFPLFSISQAARLLERKWPPEIAALLTQQVREPMEEAELRTTIPRITDVEGSVSLGVQKQYEENPYPRWMKMAPPEKATSIHAYFCASFPLASIQQYSASSRIEILIAGCGTGQHSTTTTLQFPAARVLAIDLSMSSLGYAKRKTQELGLTAIEYAQADLLKLGSAGRRFDVIESVGVLHHLEDPWAGWQALLSMLRPGGFMRLGFYSAIARQDVVRIRKFIADQGYGTTPSEIRRCRQHLITLGLGAFPGSSLTSLDFFSTSSCRDLLFHVQEHRMTLPDIAAFLQKNGLTFLGFELDVDVQGAYRVRFPNDPAGTDLGKWQIFEEENPSTFFGLYQFCVQKTA